MITVLSYPIIFKTLFLMIMCQHPIKVNSTVRSIDYNRKIGGAPKSYHLTGQAVDISLRVKPKARYCLIREAKRVFNGVIEYENHLHLDLRKTKYHKELQ